MGVQKTAVKKVQPPKTLLELLMTMLKQAPKSLLKQIPWMILVGGFTWVYHTYLLVIVNQGFDVAGAGKWLKAALSGNGSPSGILFWTFMGGIASLALNQLRQNGVGKTFKAFGMAPGWAAGALKGLSSKNLPILLVSLAVGLFILAIAHSPLYALQFGLLLLGEWLAMGKGLLGMVIPLGWSDLQRFLNRKATPKSFNSSWMAIILVGLTTSVFIGMIFPTWFMVISLVGLIVLIVIVMAAKSGKPISTGTIMLLGLLIALSALAIYNNTIVLADDGGWEEEGGTLESWSRSEGAFIAMGFGIPPAFGAALGWLFGSLLAGIMATPMGVITDFAPEISTVPDWVKDPEVAEAVKAWQKELDDAKNEADKYRKQWDEVKGTYDVNDPNYEKIKDQYEKYINYQDKRAADAQGQIDSALTLEANAQQEARYKDAYDKHREENADFINKEREKLENRDTAFDHAMDKLVSDNKEKMEQLKHLQKIRRDATDRNQNAIGETGEDDPAFSGASEKADELINNLLSGKSVSPTDIDKVTRVIKDRVSGTTQKEGEAYVPQDYLGGWIQLPSTAEELQNALTGSLRAAFTGTNMDGSTNWGGIIGRIAVGVGTAGVSEWVYTPVNMTYVSKDAIDRGADPTEALRQGLQAGAIDILMGKGIEGGIWVAGKGLSIAGKTIKQVMPGTTKAVSKFVTETVEEASSLIKGIVDAPPVPAVPKVTGVPRVVAPKPIPTPKLKAVNTQLQNALKNGDEKAILDLYKNGGMKDLAELERLGHISPDAAKQLNKTLTNSVNKAIDKGTVNSINKFHELHPDVKVSRINIGDSGSSAKGGPRSVRTDFDRTCVPEFDPDSIKDYAAKNGISPGEAERQLKAEFCDTHFSEVNSALKDSKDGLGLPNGADDVDFKTYNGIGSDAGNSDAYSYGFTTQRQALGGKTKVYVPDGEGGANSFETSGQSLIDADGLQKTRIGGEAPPDPNKIVPKDAPGTLSLQAQSANSHSDAKSLAKAFGRTDAAADSLQIHNPKMDNLRGVADEIRANPQKVNEILDAANLTEEEFVEQTRQAINEVNSTASDLKTIIERNLQNEKAQQQLLGK